MYKKVVRRVKGGDKNKGRKKKDGKKEGKKGSNISEF